MGWCDICTISIHLALHSISHCTSRLLISQKMAMNIVICLGGFHTIMNFLDAIGHLMKSSGIEEVLELVFGASAVEHLLSGKACDI